MAYKIPYSIKEPKHLSQHKDFFFDEYNYYFNEREKIKREISFALNDKVTSYAFTDWFRLTSTKYAMDPLSCIGSIKNAAQLKKEIYNVHWRIMPNIFEIPSTSQIFGQLVKNAGIEAILYRSTKNSRNGLCLAIFPENFENSDSYVELKDTPKRITNTRMDLNTFQNFY